MQEILQRYPNKLPVIFKSTEISLRRRKYLIDKGFTFGQIISVIRSREHVKSELALFFFTETNVLIPVTQLLESVYNLHANNDKILYIHIKKENTFG